MERKKAAQFVEAALYLTLISHHAIQTLNPNQGPSVHAPIH